MSIQQIVPNAENYYLDGGTTGCLLIHGFSSSAEETRPLGDYLNKSGYSVLGVRLSGHGTHPQDLARVRWSDWLADIEDGLAILQPRCERIILIGQSLGGMLALTSASYCLVDAVVAISTPYQETRNSEIWKHLLLDWIRPMAPKKGVKRHPVYGIRREANYPAYASLPSAILRQIFSLRAAMQAALPYIQVPVFLIQSRGDNFIAPDSLEKIREQLQAPRLETLLLENQGHSITMDPQGEQAFAEIKEFIESLGDSE